MKGKPPGSRALPPAGGPEAAALKNTPPGGLAVLRALDNYQMISEDLRRDPKITMTQITPPPPSS
jgi:hypothetical protein